MQFLTRSLHDAVSSKQARPLYMWQRNNRALTIPRTDVACGSFLLRPPYASLPPVGKLSEAWLRPSYYELMKTTIIFDERTLIGLLSYQRPNAFRSSSPNEARSFCCRETFVMIIIGNDP
ncbi:hypothetical protein NPIL_675361 [Nephila pilipes]|uniref:Uncharacterized protein n=1 Tax=Nephila pilipes TaxID=299642 RepID=A0A8X6TSY1_NEPPI|nr:hypothetical protein NPIL_675361 [Nephila pilipes]